MIIESLLTLLLCMTSTPAHTGTDIVMPKALKTQSPMEKQYQQLLVAYRATLGHQSKNDTTKEELTETSPEEKKEKDANLFGSLPLPAQTQTEMAFELMAHLDQPTSEQKNLALFSPDTWHSLRIIDQEPSALSGIAPGMQTIFGKIFLARLLTSPTTDIKLITARQKAIAELASNSKSNEKIIKLCSKVKPLQEQLLGLTSEEHPIYQKGLRIYLHDFFLRGIKPSSKKWNRFSKLFGDIWYFAGPITALLFIKKAMSSFLVARKANQLTNKFNIKDTPVNKALLYATLAGIIGYNGGIQIPGVLTWIKQRKRAINYFYEQLVPLKKFFLITEKLKAGLKELPPLNNLSHEIDTVLSLENNDFNELKTILLGPAFKSKIERFLYSGDIILAVDLLKKCRHLILKGIGLLGACDTYSSLADWFNACAQSKHTPLCFAQFITDADRPSLNINDFWHVLTKEKPILNSLILGDGLPQNAIITGIFESGKSTLLQGAALNVVCAQSIGLCLCRNYTGTLYASINIYANIKDDLANNRSLFKTELYRALQLLDQIKSMPAGAFSFTIADATFTGTEAGAGQAAAYAIARHLGKMNNSVALHATNFLSLAILGTQEPKEFQTFYLPSYFNGKAHQTYTLTRGTQNSKLSTSIFSEEELPEAMITTMNRHLTLQGN